LYVKHGTAKTFVIVDASMAELMRPSLYAAYHRILPVRERGEAELKAAKPVDVVGPLCETGDFLARERPFPAVEPGEVLAVLDAGAYGFVMASNYNTRPHPAEVLIADGSDHLVRHRETVEELLQKDVIPDFLES
jgi:diaminopimelate decarboxylase